MEHMKTKIKLNRNEARKLKKAQKRKLRLSKVDFYNNDIHLGTRKISANPVNGLISLEENNRLKEFIYIYCIYRGLNKA